MIHVMVDAETLATTADAVIMSLGAIKFDLAADTVDDEGFYASISIDSNIEYRRRISEDTLIWWMRQARQAQAVFEEPKTHLREALTNFSDWFGAGDALIWSNGADFDIPMLAHAYTQCGLQIPWHCYNTRCVRTWRGLPGAQAVPKPSAGTAHTALADAYNQARHVMAIYKTLFSPSAKSPDMPAREALLRSPS